MKATSLLLALACTSAIAQDAALSETARRTGASIDRVSESLKQCDYSQPDMNMCAEYEYVKADLDLNRVYRDLAGRREERDPGKLRKAQRAWIQWRDANCEYESSDIEGGSLQPLVTLNCKRRVTRERIEWILNMLSCTSIRGECRSQSSTK